MPVNLTAPQAADLHPVAGLRIGTAEAGIRKAHRKDLTVVLIEAGAGVGAVFTKNRFCAAPVQVCREHLAGSLEIRALLINTGNANAGTGAQGLERSRSSSAALAARLGLSAQQVLPFSTGVIIEPLPVERIEAGLPAAIADAVENSTAPSWRPWAAGSGEGRSVCRRSQSRSARKLTPSRPSPSRIWSGKGSWCGPRGGGRPRPGRGRIWASRHPRMPRPKARSCSTTQPAVWADPVT